jgi:hypothetical protein
LAREKRRDLVAELGFTAPRPICLVIRFAVPDLIEQPALQTSRRPAMRQSPASKTISERFDISLLCSLDAWM